MQSKSPKNSPKPNDSKKQPKDLPIRANDADQVKGGRGNAGEQPLR